MQQEELAEQRVWLGKQLQMKAEVLVEMSAVRWTRQEHLMMEVKLAAGSGWSHLHLAGVEVEDSAL